MSELARRLMALAVHGRRRSMGLTPDGLADNAGVARVVVTAMESADPTPGHMARPVLEALGMDPARHLGGMPYGPVLVMATDAGHSRVMSRLAEAAGKVDGWLMFPDVSAVDLGPSRTDADLRDVEAARDEWRHWTARLAWVPVIAAMVTTGIAVLMALRCLAASEDAPVPGWTVLAVAGTIIPLVLLGDAIEGHARRQPNPRQREVDALREVRDARRKKEMTVAEGRLRAYAASPDGILELTLSGGQVTRREWSASAVLSVGVRLSGRDPGHVTVKLDTPEGILRMPWLPATRDLLDLTENWARRAS